MGRGTDTTSEPVRLFSYVVVHDSGFAPNPFFGYCTLACCKPAIRRTANEGDWVVGLMPKVKGNKIVYAMRVDEKLSFDDFSRDKRFRGKIPDGDKGSVLYQRGDNVYMPRSDGSFRQLPSSHRQGKCENEETKHRDLVQGKYVLVSQEFKYFGKDGRSLPDCFQEIIPGRGHKSRFSEELVTAFVNHVRQLPNGIHAAPADWPSGDDSWNQGKDRQKSTA